MDLNPDQMIALGKTREGSLAVRVFEKFNRMILRQASDIIVLDRFMLDRVKKKGVPVEAKTSVIPPWPHEAEVHAVAHDDNAFRRTHALERKFVVMYSGNHSPANPLTTLLDAAERLKELPNMVFMFIGGGGGKKEVEERIATGATNIRSLPYQPLNEIKYSLSAADLHVVSIGNEVVGIVHPCKVYGALAVSRPILLLGPSPSHVSDLIERTHVGWHVNHGDVEGAVRALREAASMSTEELGAMGRKGAALIGGPLSKLALSTKLCDLLERACRT
jgi:colanic acid biosynthesis glycosyl transferase WcaI